MNYLNKLIESLKRVFSTKKSSNSETEQVGTISAQQNSRIQSLRRLVEEKPITAENHDIILKKKTRVSPEILTKVKEKRISETDGLNQISSNKIVDLSLYQQKTLDLIYNTTKNNDPKSWDRSVIETIITRIAIAQAQMENFLTRYPSLEIASFESLLRTQLKIEKVFTELHIPTQKRY